MRTAGHGRNRSPAHRGPPGENRARGLPLVTPLHNLPLYFLGRIFFGWLEILEDCLMVNKLSPTLFERKCEVDEGTGCWIWRSSFQSSGYGQVRISGGSFTAHRASWIAHRGAIPDGLQVLHKCDDRRCCNPEHLFLGTQGDNIRDAVSKGRMTGRLPAGAQRMSRVRVLTDDDIRAIRGGGETAAAVAARLGVTRSTIYRVRGGTRKALVG